MKRFKVCLVTCGLSQFYRVEHEETLVAVIRIGSVFFVLAAARICGIFVVLADIPNVDVMEGNQGKYA